jgi:hypothetical protein
MILQYIMIEETIDSFLLEKDWLLSDKSENRHYSRLSSLPASFGFN